MVFLRDGVVIAELVVLGLHVTTGRQVHLREALLDLVNLGNELGLLVEATHGDMAVTLKRDGCDVSIFSLLGLALELVQGSRDVVLGNDLMKFANQVCIELVPIVTLFFGRSAVEDHDLFVRVMGLPHSALVFLKEVHDKERVLEIDEEVAHVGHLFGLLLIGDNIASGVAASVIDIDLVPQILLCVAARKVLNAEVRAEIFALLHEFDLNRLVCGCPVRQLCRACVL